jgi:hypothetical protein
MLENIMIDELVINKVDKYIGIVNSKRIINNEIYYLIKIDIQKTFQIFNIIYKYKHIFHSIYSGSTYFSFSGSTEIYTGLESDNTSTQNCNNIIYFYEVNGPQIYVSIEKIEPFYSLFLYNKKKYNYNFNIIPINKIKIGSIIRIVDNNFLSNINLINIFELNNNTLNRQFVIYNIKKKHIQCYEIDNFFDNYIFPIDCIELIKKSTIKLYFKSIYKKIISNSLKFNKLLFMLTTIIIIIIIILITCYIIFML